MWKKRCEEIIEWETTQGITKKDKTTKLKKYQLEVREEKRKKVKEKRQIKIGTIFDEIKNKILLEKISKGYSYYIFFEISERNGMLTGFITVML